MRARDLAHPIAMGYGPLARRAPPASQIVSCPLPYLGLGDRLLLRALALVASRSIRAIHGLQHILPAADPFILAANHSTRRESVLVPALLFLHRGGRLVHFLADWNFRLIPGVGLIYARAQVVTVTRKSAKPRLLNILKPLYEATQSPLDRARAHLAGGRAIGLFPEGKVNREPGQLLRGRRGAARLSLEMGVPVVPMGIRFPDADPTRPIPASAAMELHIGAPLPPPRPTSDQPTTGAVSDWHSVIMEEIASLSGRAWIGSNSGGRP